MYVDVPACPPIVNETVAMPAFVPVSSGTTPVIVLASTRTMVCIAMLPTVKLPMSIDAGPKLSPRIVTAVPPLMGPVAGAIEVIVGGEYDSLLPTLLNFSFLVYTLTFKSFPTLVEIAGVQTIFSAVHSVCMHVTSVMRSLVSVTLSTPLPVTVWSNDLPMI